MLLSNEDAVDAEMVCDLNLFHLQGCFIGKYVVFIMISGSCDNGIFAYTQMYQMLEL